MLTRASILGLGLVMAAGAAVAANPAPAQATSKTQHAEKKTCVQRSTTGHCEKWAAPAKSDNAAKAKEQKKS